MFAVSCKDLIKNFGKRNVLNGINLDIPDGTIVALLGQSGVGKSTLGRIICGLEKPDQGTIELSRPADVMMVPQDFVVWPHLTVERNVRVGYRGSKDRRAPTVRSWLSKLGLADLMNIPAQQLSYGQQQRVAVARAFCFQPRVMVLDEPFAHLDTPGRTRAAREIATLCQNEKIAVLWITHDSREAYAVAQKLAVLDGGVIVHFDSPETAFRKPGTKSAALVTGDMNIFTTSDWQEFLTVSRNKDFPVRLEEGQILGLRPTDIEISSTHPAGCVFCAQSFLGVGYHYFLRLSSGSLVAVFDEHKRPLDQRYEIRLKRAPCVFREN